MTDRMETTEIVEMLRLHKQTINDRSDVAWERVEMLVERLETAEMLAKIAGDIISAKVAGDFTLQEFIDKYRDEGIAIQQVRYDEALIVMGGADPEAEETPAETTDGQTG